MIHLLDLSKQKNLQYRFKSPRIHSLEIQNKEIQAVKQRADKKLNIFNAYVQGSPI